jgi:eukaryotic-like serine/threonine-protein kinase
VTGTVPFVTDTTMGTLAARIGQPLPHHEALGPLDDVLARAAAPEASVRLDAAGLSARLGALAAALPTPTPLPLVFHHLEDSAPIAGFRAPGVSELTDSGVVAPGSGATGAASDISSTAIAPSMSEAPVGTRAGPGEIFDAEPLGAGRGSRPPTGRFGGMRNRRRMYVIIAAAAAAALLAAGLFVAFGTNVLTPSHPTPNVVNLPLAQAQASLARVHMNVKEAAPVKSIPVKAGDVVSQSPKAGVTQKEGSTVTLVVSDGPPDVSVPSLANMTCAQAVTALQPVHLQADCTAGTYDNNVPATIIISWSIGSVQNPTKAPYGGTITIVPSLGHEPATVPPIPTTYTYAQAAAALQAVGLTATQASGPSATVPSGNVVSTTPASGAQAPYGSQVTVNVSTGPPTTTVPNVQGDTVQQASAALQQAGLSPSGVSGNPTGTVSGTQPSIGSTVPTGSSIQLFTQ